MKRFVSLVVRLGLAGACLAYAAWGVDFARLTAVVAAFRPWAVACYLVAMLVFVLPGACRLRFLVGGRIRVGQGLAASTIGQGLNNLLPARLGEMAKTLYLSRKADLSLGQALEAVFWERFSDLNALLVLGVAVALLLREGLVLYPLLAVVGGAWCFLILLRLRPATVHAWSAFVPGQRTRLFVSEMLLLLQARLRLAFVGRLSLWTLTAWIGYGITYAVGLCLMAGLPADPALVLSVFALATLGFALPGAPGGMGVYEAAVVVALGWFGVDKDRALAVGLALHLLQYLLLTAAGLISLAGSGLSLRDLRHQARPVDETA
jgi:uncharacterized membrane protein YbhN (UPF0104 family)